jgi:hypothetical protein
VSFAVFVANVVKNGTPTVSRRPSETKGSTPTKPTVAFAVDKPVVKSTVESKEDKLGADAIDFNRLRSQTQPPPPPKVTGAVPPPPPDRPRSLTQPPPPPKPTAPLPPPPFATPNPKEMLENEDTVPMQIASAASTPARKSLSFPDAIQIPDSTRKKNQELLNDRIRKPKYSIRRIKLLCRWVNSLKLWEKQVDIMSLHTEMCSGLLLARIMKYLVPSANFLNLNPKVCIKKAAVENLEQALGFIWRSKACNTSRIPNAADILEGSTEKISILLQEIFEVYVIKSLYKDALRILRWYHKILKQYELPIVNDVFEDGDMSYVWPHFQSGTALFCVIYHFFGPTVIGTGANTVRVDPIRVFFNPLSISEFRSNLTYVMSLIRALSIDVLWDIDDWITYPDTEFMMYQLNLIYDALKGRQCSLPPAQGHTAGEQLEN